MERLGPAETAVFLEALPGVGLPARLRLDEAPLGVDLPHHRADRLDQRSMALLAAPQLGDLDEGDHHAVDAAVAGDVRQHPAQIEAPVAQAQVVLDGAIGAHP
jgi:hypothetical protein